MFTSEITEEEFNEAGNKEEGVKCAKNGWSDSIYGRRWKRVLVFYMNDRLVRRYLTYTRETS